MVKTNLLNALALLHSAGVRVNLLQDYDPAYHTTKADKEAQPVQFIADTYYLTLPEYSISAASNLNLSFVLKGKAHDYVHDKDYDAVQFKTVTLVKNRQLFKQYLDIHEDDADKCFDLGFELDDDNRLDLTQFSLEDGIDNYSDEDYAKALLTEELYQVFRIPGHRGKAPELTPEEKWLKENGYYNGVWSPKVTCVTERVKNHYTDTQSSQVRFDELNRLPRFSAITKLIEKKKDLSPTEEKIVKVFEATKNIDMTSNIKAVNTIKYARLMNNIFHRNTVEVEMYGVKFNVTVY